MVVLLGKPSEASVRVRQPLPYMVVIVDSAKETASTIAVANQVMDEVNIKALIVTDRETRGTCWAGQWRYAQQGYNDLLRIGVFKVARHL